jgi:hypothetical protein
MPQAHAEGVVTATSTENTIVVPRPQVKKVDVTAAERSWSVNDLVKRPIWVGEANWNSVQPIGNCIFTQFLPQAFFNQPLFNQAFDLFNLSRFHMTVTFTMTGTKFHQGCLMASWRPMVANDATHLKTMNSLYVTPHTFMRADRPNTVKFEIPFRYETAWYPHYLNAPDEPFGSIGLFVFSPLVFAAGATPQLSISITAQFDTLELHMPRTPFTLLNPTALLAATKEEEEKVPSPPSARSLSSRVPILPPIVTPQGSTEDATVGGGVSEKPPVIGRPVPLPHLRRDVCVSYRDMCKRLYQVSRITTPVENTASNYTFSFPSFNMMDATALYHPWINATPIAPIANMYRLARGSIRYEFDFQLNNPRTVTGVIGLAAENLQCFAMFLPKYFPALQDATKLPIYYFVPGAPDSPFWAPVVSYVTPASGQDGYPFGEVSSLMRTAGSNYARLPLADPSGVKQINYSPYHCMAPMMASANGFSCSLALEIPFVHNTDAYRVPNIWDNSTLPDNNWIGDGPVPSHGTGNRQTPYPTHGLFGPAFSPGTIVYGVHNTTPKLLSGVPTTSPLFVTSVVSGALGDDFRFGCLSNMDFTFLNGQYYQDGTFAPSLNTDMYDHTAPPPFAATSAPAIKSSVLSDDIRLVTAQGNTSSTSVVQHFAGAVSGTVPINVTGDKWDNKLDLSIPTTGMDKPSCTLQIPNGKMFQFNWRACDTGIFMGERQALTASDTDEARPGDFGTEQDEMAFEVIRKIPGICLTIPWDTTQVVGTALFHMPISPVVLNNNSSVISAFNIPRPGTGYQGYMLEKTCIPFLYWRGALRYRFRLFASGFHTGKLFIAINYHPYRSGQPQAFSGGVAAFNQIVPNDFSAAMSQYGIYIDLSDEQHDIEFEVPYVSQDVFTAINHFVSNQKNNIGTISCYVVQPLVAVPGIATQISTVMEIWAGDDFQTHTLSAQASIWSNRPVPHNA